MRRITKKIIPPALWRQCGLLRRRWLARNDHKLTAKEVFTQIYRHGMWRCSDDDGISSGIGSRDHHVVDPYVNTILNWAAEHGGNSRTALDMGCGDFHVGQRIHPAFERYIAADIVPFLIDHHRSNHQAANLEFRCIDAIDAPLPEEADVVFFRQVLQHLSNAQIARIIPKLRKFRDVIITEHLPTPNKNTRYNLDKPHGGGIRLNQNSGIDLELPPFDLSPTSAQIILEVPASIHTEHDGLIRTTWYQFAPPSKS